MAYLTQDALEAMGFAHLGREVRISDKAAIYNADQMRIGDYSRIDDFCVVSGQVEVGRNVHLAPFCLMAGGRAGIVIEDFAGFAYGAQVFAQSDDYSGAALTNPTVPARFTRVTYAPVRVGRHVIVGAGAIVTPGCDLAEGCSIGAQALVLAPTEPWFVYIGSPARKLRPRSRDMLALEAAYLAEDAAQRDAAGDRS